MEIQRRKNTLPEVSEYGKRFFLVGEIITFDKAHHCPGEPDDNLFLVTGEVVLLRGFRNPSLCRVPPTVIRAPFGMNLWQRLRLKREIITFDKAHHCPGEPDDNLFLVTGEDGLLRGFRNPSLVGSFPLGGRTHSERLYGNVHVLNVTRKCLCNGLIATWDERDCPDGLSDRRALYGWWGSSLIVVWVNGNKKFNEGFYIK
ncbi:hypothetical protein CEXT_718891 [Caerostris extrusa]|uniref:Uncharacterized protein n=1 Tax=Caerostris extrusa TaxID=172846 RepID=A0AAV4PTZ0_CAEEX|nr:hypothetical protein CEXT_718891 [Caerostris extrusa]